MTFYINPTFLIKKVQRRKYCFKKKKKKTFTLCVRSLVVGKKKYDKFHNPSLRFGLIPIKSTTFKK